jgi:hypothetical protein
MSEYEYRGGTVVVALIVVGLIIVICNVIDLFCHCLPH